MACPDRALILDSLFFKIESTFTCKVLSMVEACSAFCLVGLHADRTMQLNRKIVFMYLLIITNSS